MTPVVWEGCSLVTTEEIPHVWDGFRRRNRERKGFFRRLAESKGAPPINHEVVWFTRRPS